MISTKPSTQNKLRMRKLRLSIALVALPGLFVGGAAFTILRQVGEEQLNQSLVGAIRNKDSTTAIRLLRSGADANTRADWSRDRSIRTILGELAQRFSTKGQKEVPDLGPPAVILHYAIEWPGDHVPEDISLIEALLMHGAKVTAQSEYGDLMSLACDHDHWRTLQLLLRYGYPAGKCGEACWKCAAQDKSGSTAKALIDYSVDVNSSQDDGTTALMDAASAANYPMVSLLVSHGAEIDRCDREGQSALIDAAGFQDIRSVRLLLDRGADINRRSPSTNTWGTALMRAIVNRDVPMVRLLIARGADPNLSCKFQNGLEAPLFEQSPLAVARENHYDGIASLLVRAGARQ